MFCFLENALQRSFLIFLIHFHGYKSKHLTAVFKHGNHVNLHSEQTFVTLPNTSILIDGALPPTQLDVLKELSFCQILSFAISLN